MSEPDRMRQREHWQAIADQLGLGPEPDESSAPQAKPDREPARGKQEPAAEATRAPAEPEDRPEEERRPHRGRRGRSGRADKGQAPREEYRPASAPESDAQDIGAEPARSSEEGPRRGRRRPAARKPAAAEGEAGNLEVRAEGSGEGEATGKAAERSEHRGRGRGRQKKADPVKVIPKPASDEKPVAKAATPEGAEDADLDDFRSLSNWNVPSWNELIASLYRPER